MRRYSGSPRLVPVRRVGPDGFTPYASAFIGLYGPMSGAICAVADFSGNSAIDS